MELDVCVQFEFFEFEIGCFRLDDANDGGDNEFKLVMKRADDGDDDTNRKLRGKRYLFGFCQCRRERKGM